MAFWNGGHGGLAPPAFGGHLPFLHLIVLLATRLGCERTLEWLISL
jgi:hypothetical protein